MIPLSCRFWTACLGGPAIAAALLCALPGVVLAATGSEESRAHYETAVDYAQKGDLRAAMIELKNALQRDPSNGEARLLLGEVYLKLGDGAAAEKELTTAQRLGIERARLAVSLGQAMLLQGHFERVLNDFPAETLAPPLDLEVLLLRAEARAGLGRRDAARQDYDNAARKAPQEARAYLGLGRLELAEGNFDAAEAQATAALARQAGLGEALLLQAEARRLGGRPEDSVEPFQAILAAADQPDSLRLRANLGLASALIALQRDGEAEGALAAVQEIAPDTPLASYLQAVLKLRKRDFEAARRLLDAAAPALESFSPAQFLFGIVYYQTGELETARSWLVRHLGAHPGNLQARKLLAATLLRLNATEKALQLLEPVYSQLPDDPQILLLLGNAYLRSGRAAEASRLLQHAAELAPEDPRVLGQLAISQLATGQREEALTSLNATLDLGSDASAIGYALAFAHLQAGDFQDALKVAQDLRKRFPDSVVAANLEGGAHAALGQIDEARAAFEAVLTIDPTYQEARANLAALKAQAGDFAGAEAEYKRVLAVDPSSTPALLGMAALANRSGDRAATERWLASAVKADPDGLKPSLALAEHHARGGEAEAAVKVMEELAGRQPRNPQVLLALGRVQGRAGQAAAAVASYKRLVDVTGGSTGARLLLAEAQLATGDLAAAQSSYEALKLMAADNPTVWNNLAWLYQQAGDDRAVAHGERALELAPGQPAIMDTLGWILLDEKGQLARATDLLKQAHEAAPGVGDIAFHYAAALHKSGDDKAARALLQPLLQSGQPFAARAEAAALLEQIGG